MTFFSRWSICVLSVLLLLGVSTRHAVAKGKPKPDPNVQIRAALGTAQTVFLQGTTGADSPDFLAFFSGMQALNRYQFVTSPSNADLILQYGYGAYRSTRTITAIDGKTLQPVGALSFFGGGWLGKPENLAKASAGLLAQMTQLIRETNSSFTGTIKALPSPPVMPDRPATAEQLESELRAAHSIFLVDRGIPKGFPAPKNSPYQPGELLGLLKAAFNSWNRYQVVDSLKGADMVIEFKGYYFSDQAEVFTGDKGFKAVGGITPELSLTVLDAKTLTLLCGAETDLDTKAKKSRPDPKVAMIQSLTDQVKKCAGDTVPK